MPGGSARDSSDAWSRRFPPAAGTENRVRLLWRRIPRTTMKHTIVTLTSLLALGAGAATFTSGCAGTATRESTGEYVDDAAITAKVKAAFVKDPVVKALDVKVETFKGTVQLSGFVDNGEQKARAEQLASSTNGVVGVRNNITLKAAGS